MNFHFEPNGDRCSIGTHRLKCSRFKCFSYFLCASFSFVHRVHPPLVWIYAVYKTYNLTACLIFTWSNVSNIATAHLHGDSQFNIGEHDFSCNDKISPRNEGTQMFSAHRNNGNSESIAIV